MMLNALVGLLLFSCLSTCSVGAYFNFKKIPNAKEPFKTNEDFASIETLVIKNIKSAVSDNHLQSVAKSMKTVLDHKVKKFDREAFFKSGPFKRVQPKVRINAAPYSQHIATADRSSDVVNIKSSEYDQFRFIAKTMKAVFNKEIKIHNLEQSVIQGFKVEGDSSNKIVFLDLEALRRTGIDLERVSIAAGTHSRSLKQIEGLKAKSSNFNSVVNEIRSDQDGKTEPQLRIPVYEQFAKVTEAENLPRIPSANIKDYQRTPLKPFIAVKHVVASQASRGYQQVPLDSRITAPTADATVIKPLANTEATKRQSLFFGKFQGKHEAFGIQDHRKHQEPVHQHVTSSTTVSPVTHGDDDFCVCLLPNQSCDICEVTCQADCNDLSREGGRCFSSLACDGTLQFELDSRSSESSLWY